jgi:hypothetical protein
MASAQNSVDGREKPHEASCEPHVCCTHKTQHTTTEVLKATVEAETRRVDNKCGIEGGREGDLPKEVVDGEVGHVASDAISERSHVKKLLDTGCPRVEVPIVVLGCVFPGPIAITAVGDARGHVNLASCIPKVRSEIR